MLDYLIKVLLFQALFLAVYDLFLKRETFFQINRGYLLATSCLAYALPLISIKRVQNLVPSTYQDYFTAIPEVFITPSVMIRDQFSWSAVLLWAAKGLLFLGMIVMGILFIIRLYKLRRLIINHPKEKKQGFNLVWMKFNEAYSFFSYIFIGVKIPDANYEQVITHELVHVKQYHTVDLLFFEVQKILAWFNPFSYLYQNRIAELHEFIADEKAVKYHDKSSYFNHLLSHSFGIDNYSFVNPFLKHSLIKKRIIMLNKKKSNQLRKLKYLLLIPVLGGMLLYASCTSQNDIIDPNQTETIEEIVLGEDLEKSQGAATVLFATLEESPLYPGMEATTDKQQSRKSFQDSIRHHVNKKFNTSGLKDLGLNPGKNRVHVQFTISSTGEVKDVLARAAHKNLEEEAIRVVNSLPKMTPGKQNGVAVNVKYTLPITLFIAGDTTAQTNPSNALEELAKIDNNRESSRGNTVAIEGNEVLFAIIEEAPVFPGCTGTRAEQRKCLQDKIRMHINSKYNTKLAKALGLSPGKKRVHVQFTIDKAGNIVNIRSRGPHTALEEEAIRVVQLLPKMIPGKQRGQNVGVKYTVPITLQVGA